MSTAKAYAVLNATTPLQPFRCERREPGPNDVVIVILYCGICHSDIDQARNNWGFSRFPMVPGHEITGRVASVGPQVTRHKIGDIVGVGFFVDSCRHCSPCEEGNEHYCESGMKMTYNSLESDGKTPTYGGYSDHIVVDEHYVLRIPPALSPAGAAPLLCAGITTYSPLRRANIGNGSRVGVIGLGGLGHIAVKLAMAMGAAVTVLSTSESKRADAARLGAAAYVNTREKDALKPLAGTLDLIINTVSAPLDYMPLMAALKRGGSVSVVGVPLQPIPVPVFSLYGPRFLSASMIGGIRETQEMLDFCAAHGIAADIELISIRDVNVAYERVLKSDVRYRFVIDLKTLRDEDVPG